MVVEVLAAQVDHLVDLETYLFIILVQIFLLLQLLSLALLEGQPQQRQEEQGQQMLSRLICDEISAVSTGVRFSMAVTRSTPQPQLVGNLRAYVKAALPSSTFYIDPQIM